MAGSEGRSETTLRLTRTLKAPREKVFWAWTTSEALKSWYGPEGWTTPSAEVDLRVGGGYRIVMKGPQAEEIILSGTYREVQPPERLVYTWQWEKFHIAIGAGETLVTVEFRDRKGSTEIILTHERFPTQKDKENHEWGWNSCFDCLEKALA